MTNTPRSQQRWLVTGASSGFGREIVRCVLRSGGTVVATARNVSVIEDLVAEGQGRCFAVALDLANPDQIAAAAAEAERLLGGIDVLANNAGYGALGSVEECPDAEVRAMFEVNFFGLAALTREVLPGMRRRRHGWIVNISSMVGRISMPSAGYYSASKFAVEGLSKALRAELAPCSIGVTVVEPGPFRTDFSGRSLVAEAVCDPDYDQTVGATIRQVRSDDGTQPGDPILGAEAIVRAIDMDVPPFQLVLGVMAWDLVSDQLKSELAELEATAAMSRTTEAVDA